MKYEQYKNEQTTNIKGRDEISEKWGWMLIKIPNY